MIRAFGEAALLVELGSAERAQALWRSIQDQPIGGVDEAVPGLESLLVELDPLATDSDRVAAELERRISTLTDRAMQGRRHTIRVAYGGADGPDLAGVAANSGLTESEVAERHAATPFSVLFLGFAPGFAYLGGLPDELDVPRLETPRTHTPAGSVAIAGGMCGIYPADLPGGWRVIGRTDQVLFDPQRDPPALLAPGDVVRFEPIRRSEDPG